MNPGGITESLAGLSRGDPEALERLLPVVCNEVRRIAAGYLKNERAGHTLQPTALAHEAFLKLVVQKKVTWQNRAHFFAEIHGIRRAPLSLAPDTQPAGKTRRCFS